jgi:hypothetical protein
VASFVPPPTVSRLLKSMVVLGVSAIIILLESGVGWEQAEAGEDWKAWRLESMLRREI